MGFLDEDETLAKKFSKIQQEANLKAFLSKEEINDQGREKRKLEAKKDKTAEDEKKIRQIQQKAEQLADYQRQAQQAANHASLGEKILKCYFTYKMASLFCHTLTAALDYDRGGVGGGSLQAKIDDEIEEKIQNGELDVPTARAEQIEHLRDQFDQINAEAQDLGISQDDLFSQQDKDNMTELAGISRDTDNPQQAELYADKCEELGLDREEALQAFQQDKDGLQNEVEHAKEQSQSYEIGM